jgi:hypothetical protein
MVVVRMFFAEAICWGVASRLDPKAVRSLSGVPSVNVASLLEELVLSS